MLLIGLSSLLIAIPLYSSTITPGTRPAIGVVQLTRITSIILLFSAALSFNSLQAMSTPLMISNHQQGLGLYSGLFHVTTVTQFMEVFLFIVGAFILLPWASTKKAEEGRSDIRSVLTLRDEPLGKYQGETQNSAVPSIAEYPLIVLFTTIGASFLISSVDLVSMYLSIELQSFAVYILAAIYRNSESATSAGLKYFLLGALSSALILLGSSIIYAYTGLTNFDGIYMIASSDLWSETATDNFYPEQTDSVSHAVVLGILIIGVGFLFKVAAAPFHNWAPDVYDGVPTIVTTWLTVMPKISLFVFLLELQIGSVADIPAQLVEHSAATLSVVSSPDHLQPNLLENAGPSELSSWSELVGDNAGNVNIWKHLLLTTSLLSLVVGTVVGLAQYRLKRLLAFSTISHVGFLLLALAVNSEESVTSFLFYLMQYSLTNVNAFFIVLALGYVISAQPYPSRKGEQSNNNTDITFISQLKGQFYANPILGLSLALCLFSMAGIPPLVGFFAKYSVLYSAIENGYYFLALVGILASVISAAYYLRIIRVIHFDATPVTMFPTISDRRSEGETAGNADRGPLPNVHPSFLSDPLLNSEQKAKKINQISPAVSSGTGNTQDFGESSNTVLTSTHSYVIAVLTLFITLFILSPSLFLNSSNLLALSLFIA